jgi:hypothetical protein
MAYVPQTERAKRLGTNLINIPCHISLVVRLHEQISTLTIFPCQGKANMLAFPCQGKHFHFTPSTRAIFPCQGKLVKEKLLVLTRLYTLCKRFMSYETEKRQAHSFIVPDRQYDLSNYLVD